MSDDELDAATLLDHAWPEPILVCYNRRDLLLYALGIGCDELCFVHEDSSAFAAFPTYPAVLGFKGDALDVVSFPSPAMMQSPMPFLPGTRVILDAERYIERVRPLPTDGGSLLLRTKLVGVLPKGKGALLQTESELSDASGTLLYRLQAASFAVGAKGFKRAGMVHSRPAEPQHGQTRRPARGRAGAPTARGALTLAHGGPLGFRAERGLRGPPKLADPPPLAVQEPPARPCDCMREQRVSEGQAHLLRVRVRVWGNSSRASQP